jgi:hypothetical protein
MGDQTASRRSGATAFVAAICQAGDLGRQWYLKTRTNSGFAHREGVMPGKADKTLANGLGIAISLVALTIGVFLGQRLLNEHWQQDCAVTANPSCTPMMARSAHHTQPERAGGWHQLTDASRPN